MSKRKIACAAIAWLLFSFRLLATKLLFAPLYKMYKTWLQLETQCNMF